MSKRLLPAQTATMIKATAQRPDVRVDSINKAVKERDYAADASMKDYGIQVNPNLLTVKGRVLDPPRIIYRDVQQIAPQMGAWQSRGVEMFESNSLENWGVLNLEHR